MGILLTVIGVIVPMMLMASCEHGVAIWREGGVRGC